MTRKYFLQSLAVAVAGLYLRLAPEKTDALETAMSEFSTSSTTWMIVGGYKIPRQLGMKINKHCGIQLIGEFYGAKVYYDPYYPTDEILLGYKGKDEILEPIIMPSIRS